MAISAWRNGVVRPVGGDYSTDVAWVFAYQVVPPGGTAADT